MLLTYIADFILVLALSTLLPLVLLGIAASRLSSKNDNISKNRVE